MAVGWGSSIVTTVSWAAAVVRNFFMWQAWQKKKKSDKGVFRHTQKKKIQKKVLQPSARWLINKNVVLLSVSCDICGIFQL